MKPLVTMPDVLLACGELNKRERVAVQWVIDRYEKERSAGLTVYEAYDVWRSFHFRHQNDGEKYMDYLEARNAAYRARLTDALAAKSRTDEA